MASVAPSVAPTAPVAVVAPVAAGAPVAAVASAAPVVPVARAPLAPVTFVKSAWEADSQAPPLLTWNVVTRGLHLMAQGQITDARQLRASVCALPKNNRRDEKMAM